MTPRQDPYRRVPALTAPAPRGGRPEGDKKARGGLQTDGGDLTSSEVINEVLFSKDPADDEDDVEPNKQDG